MNEESYPKHDEQVLAFESSGFSIRLPYSIKEHKGELTAPMREICTYLMDGFGLTQENAEQLVRLIRLVLMITLRILFLPYIIESMMQKLWYRILCSHFIHYNLEYMDWIY